MPDQTIEPFTAGPASSYVPVVAELTEERDRLAAERTQLVLELGNMRGIAQGNMRYVATLTGLLDAVQALSNELRNAPGNQVIYKEAAADRIDRALTGGPAPVPGSSRRAQDDPMPVFVIKAKDEFALAAIRAYRALCDEHGLRDQAREVGKAHREMREWRVRHPELTKLPDHKHMPAGESQASEPADSSSRRAQEPAATCKCPSGLCRHGGSR